MRIHPSFVLAAGGFLLPVVAVFSPLALAPLFAVAAVAALALDPRGVWVAAQALWPLAALLGALAAWGMLSAAWSIVPGHSFAEGLRLLSIAAGGIVLLAAARGVPAEERRLIGVWAAAGLALALALLLFEAASGAALTRLVLRRNAVPLQRFDRAATTAVLAFWAVLAMGARGWIERAALAVATAASIYLLDSAAAALALALAAAIFALAWVAPRVVAVALAAGLAAVAVAVPLAVPSYQATLAMHQRMPAIKWSGVHRLLIWRFTADRIAERPVLGWGMDASRALPGGKTRFADLFPAAHLEANAEALPLHPHNAALQWQVELGVPGTLLGLGAVAWGLWRVGAARVPRVTRAAGLAWAAAALVVALLDYGAWQEWWLGCLFLSAATAAAGTPADSADTPARHRP
jgi:O-antigen ligase